MKTILFLLLMSATCLTHAQTLNPNKLVGKPKPAGVDIHLKSPCDLQVYSFSLHSITRNNAHGTYQVTVSVGVRNNGEQPSSSITTLKCFYSDASGVIHPPSPLPPGANDPGHGTIGPWTPCAAEPKLPVLQGGQSWGGDLSFEVLYNDIDQRDKFYFIMLADYYNNSVESNERNNYSTPIFITPPNH